MMDGIVRGVFCASACAAVLGTVASTVTLFEPYESDLYNKIESEGLQTGKEKKTDIARNFSPNAACDNRLGKEFSAALAQETTSIRFRACINPDMKTVTLTKITP